METTTDNFQADVLDASTTLPILVDFWAPWCGPCRVLTPVLERLESRADGRWRLVKLNTEDHPAIAAEYKISSIPAVKLFRDGKVVGEFVGALPEAKLQAWLDTFIASPVQEQLDAVKAAIKEGAGVRAQALLESLVAANPQNAEAHVLLAGLLLLQDRARARTLLDDIHEGDVAYEQADGIRTLARLLDLHEDPASTAPLRDARGGPQYLAGIAALTETRYGDALAAFIGVLRQNRKLDDDGARRACVALFRWLGDEHPMTREHRRAFSSALF